MKLTGKCLEDFEIFYITELRKKENIGDRYFVHTLLDFFWRSGDTMINAFIIEFFDSVGIYINIMLDETNPKKFKFLITDIQTRHLHCWTDGVNKETRQEAANEAIEKANEIYNEKHK